MRSETPWRKSGIYICILAAAATVVLTWGAWKVSGLAGCQYRMRALSDRISECYAAETEYLRAISAIRECCRM